LLQALEFPHYFFHFGRELPWHFNFNSHDMVTFLVMVWW